MRAFALYFFLSTLLFLGSVRAQTKKEAIANDARLDRIVGAIVASEQITTETALARVLANARVSGGIVEVGSCDPREKDNTVQVHTIDVAGLTLRQALDAIVATDGRYRWVLAGNAVNIFPTSGIPEILKKRLPHFETHPNSTNLDVQNLLLNTSEVRSFLAVHGYTREDRLTAIIGRGAAPLIHALSIDDTTVLHVLNATAESMENPAVWHYTERTGACKPTYHIDWPVL